MMHKYPDLETLLKYERSGANPTLPAGNGVISQNISANQDDVDIPNAEYIRTGNISAKEYKTICRLSTIICNEHDYMSICDSLGVPLYYGTKLNLNS